VIRYEFPWPPKALSPNARVHWRRLAQAKSDYQQACGWAVLEAALGTADPPLTAQVTFVVTDKRRRDSDNHMAMLKPLWDALVALDILRDDSHDQLRIAEPKWARGPAKKVIVELSPFRDGGE